jgi:DNA anti-recombination protein RmuC
MKALRALCSVMMVPGCLWAQASPQKADSSTNDSDVAAELKAVREALSQTQKQMASQQQALTEALSQTQKQIAAQQQEIEALKSQSRAEQTASVRNEHQHPEQHSHELRCHSVQRYVYGYCEADFSGIPTTTTETR